MIDMPMVVHWVTITAVPKYGGGTEKIFLRWENMSFEMCNKWRWYFEYRAALLKVQNPKWKVDMAWGNEEAITGSQAMLRLTRKRWISSKARFTKKFNELKRVEDNLSMAISNWVEVFPIEDDPRYAATIQEIERRRTRVKELEIDVTVALKAYEHELQISTRFEKEKEKCSNEIC